MRIRTAVWLQRKSNLDVRLATNVPPSFEVLEKYSHRGKNPGPVFYKK
jgi:hypothetical protein